MKTVKIRKIGNSLGVVRPKDVQAMLNGVTLVASEASAAIAFLSVAAGDTSEDELADWLRQNTKR